MSCRLFVVDVFAQRRYAGNPLAVVVADDALADDEMQAVAAEMNFSETSFVVGTSDADGAHRVTMFTPARRIGFAGHAILGSAWVIRHTTRCAPRESLRLRLDEGIVPVRFDEEDVAWFTAPTMRLGPTCPPAIVAAAVGLAQEDIETRTPVQQVSAGSTAALLVPLRGRDALARCRLDLARFAPLAARGFPPLVYLFCHEPGQAENDLRARFFFDAHGVREDPATGNGAAFLGAYLLEHGLLADRCGSLRIAQGDELRRPSLVRLRARRVDGQCDVSVGGRVVPTLEGVLPSA